MAEYRFDNLSRPCGSAFMRTFQPHQVARGSPIMQTTRRSFPIFRISAWMTAACLALTSTAASAAEPLGRLFFTPEQRATLEARRLAPPSAPAAAPSSDRVSVDGIVQRSDGPATVWINGVPRTVSPGSLVPSAKGGPAAVEVPVPEKDQRVRLRVGETLVIAPPPGESDPDATAKPGAGSRPTGQP